ncbi:MAG: tripartite tricarboxylate transporter TctB family protein [Gammaproteobacteria bacterium]|nr:tripartite tricarboxylate transporter TctB family protein [Gammaproteobacteria bacterium]
MAGSRLAAAAGGLSALAFGIVLLAYLIPVYVPEPQYAAPDAPGPQALPRTIAWAFIILGGMDACAVLFSGERLSWQPPEALGRLLLVGGIVLVALLLMPWLGMLPVGVVMMIAITSFASGQRLRPAVLTALIFAAAVYVIFVLVAGIPLPVGTQWE